MNRNEFSIAHSFRLDYDTPYYAALKETWARQLENAVRSLPKFDWEMQQSLPLQHQQAAQVPPTQQSQSQAPWGSQQGQNGAYLMSPRCSRNTTAVAIPGMGTAAVEAVEPGSIRQSPSHSRHAADHRRCDRRWCQVPQALK